MKRVFLLIVLAAVSSVGFAQTKRIAHRSHSGANRTFSLNGIDNFGTTPEMIKKQQEAKAKADSIAKKAVTDSIARIIKLQPVPKNKTKTKHKNTVSKTPGH